MKQTRHVITCDRCKAETVSPVSFWVHVGYFDGAASQEDDQHAVDLCCKCAAVALQRAGAASADFTQAAAFVEMVKDPNPMKPWERP